MRHISKKIRLHLGSLLKLYLCLLHCSHFKDGFRCIMENIDSTQILIIIHNIRLLGFIVCILSIQLIFDNFNIINGNRVRYPFVKVFLKLKAFDDKRRKCIFQQIINLYQITVLIIQKETVTHLIGKPLKR